MSSFRRGGYSGTIDVHWSGSFVMKNLKIVWLLFLAVFLIGCTANSDSPSVQSISISSRSSSLTVNFNGNLGNSSDSEVVTKPQGTVETAQAPDGGKCNVQVSKDFELAVLNRINEARVAAGLPKLFEQAQLTSAARQHSVSMGCENFFGHTGSYGASVENRIQSTGYGFKALSEVIAAGYDSPDEVVEGWLGSDLHRAIILGEFYTEIGIGFAELPESKYVYYWTIILGRP
ncbi:MAG: CAP domain-containing protein [Anaerolineales bacterium]|jgi:uncharacterized protein YkwD